MLGLWLGGLIMIKAALPLAHPCHSVAAEQLKGSVQSTKDSSEGSFLARGSA